jgi:hypothetical protein
MVWYATATIPTENRLDYVCLNICHLIDSVLDPVPSRAPDYSRYSCDLVHVRQKSILAKGLLCGEHPFIMGFFSFKDRVNSREGSTCHSSKTATQP